MARRAVASLVALVRRQTFVLRWVVAITVSLSAVSLVQYVVTSRQLETTLLEHSSHDFQGHIDTLEKDLADGSSTGNRQSIMAAAVADIFAEEQGLDYVGVFDSNGAEVATTEPGEETVTADERSAVITSDQTVASEDADAGEVVEDLRFQFLIPLHTPQGVLIVKIEQNSEVIGAVLADLRHQQVLGLLGSILFAVPLSYLIGGRTLRRRHNEAHQQAERDDLTGIFGRRPFRPVLSAALANAAIPHVCLAIVDIDQFKGVNDRLGHSYGDRVLVALGQSFDQLRGSDTAFRLGGDEFAVVLTAATDREAAEVIDRVRTSFGKRMPGVTISCGIAAAQHADQVPLQELWERADSALYEAKRRGRDRTVTFASLTVGVTVAANKLEAVHDLCDSAFQCSVAFQPIWDLRAGRILGHEALLRLPASMPLEGPAEAFELADRVGRAAELDALARAVLLRTVKHLPWPGGLLFVNVHHAALREFDVDAFAAKVIAAGLAQTDVIIEVTERADLDNPINIRTLKRAQARGFMLALDGLGAGNAGLRALANTQFDVIKLDRRVVSRLGVDPAADAVLAAAAMFVRNTDGWVVAEGIEDLSTLDAVLDDSAWRSDSIPLAGQGYLLGYPATDPQGMDTRLDLLDHPVSHDLHEGDRGTAAS